MEEYGEDIDQYQQYVKTMIQYILNNSVDKLPIKKSDIVSLALENKGEIFSKIIDIVKKQLKEIYGFILHEVPNRKPVTYICTSNFSGVLLEEYTQNQKSQITLLFLILTYIFMKGRPADEESLFKFLEKMKIKVNECHEYFGSNLRKLITDTFVKQLYLKKDKISVENSDEKIVYSWGYRSTIEFPKALMLKKVAGLLEKPEICFVQQHREVYGEDFEMEVDSQSQAL